MSNDLTSNDRAKEPDEEWPAAYNELEHIVRLAGTDWVERAVKKIAEDLNNE